MMWCRDKKYILFAIACVLAGLSVFAAIGENAEEGLPYRIVGQFGYCREGDGVREAEFDSLTEAEAFHWHIIAPILSALAHDGSARSEVGNARYRCKHYKIMAEDPKDCLIEVSVLSDIEGYAPASALIEDLRGRDYSVVDIISEAPVVCLVFAEADRLVAVTCNMFCDLDKVCSIARAVVKRQREQSDNTQTATFQSRAY